MDWPIKNKVAIVTGEASGIGEKTTEFFVQKGVKVFVTDNFALFSGENLWAFPPG